jgi:hypothetical protein
MIIYDRQWKVPSDSSDKIYTVSLKDSVYSCSCPAWTRRTPRKNCKHINRVLAGWYDSETLKAALEIIPAIVEQVSWSDTTTRRTLPASILCIKKEE